MIVLKNKSAFCMAPSRAICTGLPHFTLCSAALILYTSSMFRRDFTFSKRQLGFILLLGGLAGFLAILSIDLLDIGREGGIGPMQQMALLGMAAAALLGLSLIPLGSDPA